MALPHDLWEPRALFAGWLAATAALAFQPLLAALGQALGAVAGGCAWIGVSLPVDRPVWALVNQPTLAFAASWDAVGYWLGSLLLPLMPRARTFAAEVVTLQLAWGAAVLGLAWMPMIDPDQGHLARFLILHRWPPALLWLAPATAAVLTPLIVLRLLAVARQGRGHLGRLMRMALVAAYLGLPAVAAGVVSTVIRGTAPVAAALAAGAVLAVAMAVAWIGYPPALVRDLARVTAGSQLRLVAAAGLLLAVLVVAGRPLPDGDRSGLLWSSPTGLNNIRPWIDPLTLVAESPQPVLIIEPSSPKGSPGAE